MHRFDSKRFHAAIDGHRHQKRLNWKRACKEAGVPHTVQYRLERGEGVTTTSMARLAGWAGLTVNDYVVDAGEAKEPEPMRTVRQVIHDTPDMPPQVAGPFLDLMRQTLWLMKQ